VQNYGFVKLDQTLRVGLSLTRTEEVLITSDDMFTLALVACRKLPIAH